MNKPVITICLLLLSYSAFSQNQNTGLGAEKYKEFLSAQASSMMRFDHVEPISNDGSPVVKIPLYTVDDPDFDISGTLQYSSGGFKPGDNDNFVGRDWTLMHGGIIYREVKGMPDDFLKESGIYAQDGFLANVKKPVFNDAQTKSLLETTPETNITQNIFSETMGDMTFVLRSTKAMREINSDIYHFRFGPHAGKFMINFDGTVNVVSYTGHKYIVDLSNYKNIRENRDSNFDSSITIKTDDGYSYKFGGNLGALEYTALSWIKQLEFDSPFPEMEIVISAMHLTEVKSANSRTLKYIYMNNVDKSIMRHRKNMVLNEATYNQLKTSKGYLNCVLNVRAYHYDQTPYSPTIQIIDGGWLIARKYDPNIPYRTLIEKSFSLNKVAIMEAIESDNNRIEFSYEERKVPYIDKDQVMGASPFPSECGAELRSVQIYGKDSSGWCYLKVHDLDYEYNGCRMFLKQVTNAEDGTYVFKYNFESANPYTGKLDHWGYLNNTVFSKEPWTLVPVTLSPDWQDQVYWNDNREPNTALCSANMLTYVYFPTGGYTIYEYEPHTYSSSITQERSNSFRKKLTRNNGNENKYAGGARIRKITYCGANDIKVKQVSYKYTQGIDLTQSSGILMHFPRYTHHEPGYCLYPNYSIDPPPMPLVYENGDGVNISPAGNHVQYSRIIEITQEETPLKNSVYKETVFSDYATNPDGLGNNKFYYSYPQTVASLDEIISMGRDYDYFCWIRADMEDLSHERGKILRETYYAGAAGIEKQIDYQFARKNTDKYNVLISCPAMYNTSFLLIYRPVKVVMCSYHPIGKVVTEYRHGVSHVSSETYEVDNDGYLISKICTTSKGDQHKTKYDYFKNYFESIDSGGLLREKSEWLITSEGEKMLSRQCYGYSGGRLVDLRTYSTGDVVVEDTRCIYTDDYGNPILVSRQDEEQEIIIWGYNGTRPVAIIKNSEFDDVKRILGYNRILNKPRNFYKKIEPEELDALRLKLPEAHITTIEYDTERQPIVVTDPAGIKTHYSYYNRKLTKAYRTDGYKETVLESHSYNFNINNK